MPKADWKQMTDVQNIGQPCRVFLGAVQAGHHRSHDSREAPRVTSRCESLCRYRMFPMIELIVHPAIMSTLD